VGSSGLRAGDGTASSIHTCAPVAGRAAPSKGDAAPVASVILFTGGQGVLQLTRGNFLVRNRRRFAEHGFLVAVVDVPSDHKTGYGRESDRGLDQSDAVRRTKRLLRRRRRRPRA